MPDHVIAVIPARYASVRFPGKALAQIRGKAMIVRVLERVSQARGISRVVVATDDLRIVAAVRAAGGEAVMTRTEHISGTERMAEVAESLKASLYLNVQGDEPLVQPAALEDLIAGMPATETGPSDASVATLATPIMDPLDAADPRVVKVVTDLAGNALLFSRAPIPYARDAQAPGEAKPGSDRPTQWKHLGVYLYRRDLLLKFPKLPPGRIEHLEMLEQLRLLEHGYKIRVVETPHDTISVDVPSDVRRVEAALRE
ncbi:MAG TPA: 3-deoxy-manno-octulosonate cytidylyltransferase [Candidatus Acidoferrales bacterium]|nr:3-deoxy-manno-octulosonate cytidylyltransferase [Candidatus Acidoferrales bacterium]